MDPLETVPFFHQGGLDGLAWLIDIGRPRVFRPGGSLMRQGEPADCLYVILRGRVRVECSHPSFSTPVVLAELGEGEVVGEMGVLDG